MRREEHFAAVALIRWWAIESRKRGIPETLLFATPNGGARDIRTAVSLKAEGVRPGVSDYFLAVPRGGAHGIFLELKRGGPGIPKGRATPEQLAFGKAVEEQGYAFTVAFGAIEAEDAIASYLDVR